MRQLAVALLVCAALAGCKAKAKKKGDAAGDNRPVTMTPVERKRGEDACTTYLKQACGCAEGKAEDDPVSKKCRDGQVKKDTLDSLLAVDNDLGSSDDSRLRVQIEARKVIAKCVMEHASLPSIGCPSSR